MEIHPRCAHPHDIRRFWGLDRVRRTDSIFSAEIAKRAESKNLVEILGRSGGWLCSLASSLASPNWIRSADRADHAPNTPDYPYLYGSLMGRKTRSMQFST